jgi:hypothetical protein
MFAVPFCVLFISDKKSSETKPSPEGILSLFLSSLSSELLSQSNRSMTPRRPLPLTPVPVSRRSLRSITGSSTSLSGVCSSPVGSLISSSKGSPIGSDSTSLSLVTGQPPSPQSCSSGVRYFLLLLPPSAPLTRSAMSYRWEEWLAPSPQELLQTLCSINEGTSLPFSTRS